MGRANYSAGGRDLDDRNFRPKGHDPLLGRSSLPTPPAPAPAYPAPVFAGTGPCYFPVRSACARSRVAASEPKLIMVTNSASLTKLDEAPAPPKRAGMSNSSRPATLGRSVAYAVVTPKISSHGPKLGRHWPACLAWRHEAGLHRGCSRHRKVASEVL